MIGMYASAIALLVAGAATGILVMVCLGIKRDDRPGGFPADAHARTARAARKMPGARTRSPELAAEASRRQQPEPGMTGIGGPNGDRCVLPRARERVAGARQRRQSLSYAQSLSQRMS